MERNERILAAAPHYWLFGGMVALFGLGLTAQLFGQSPLIALLPGAAFFYLGRRITRVGLWREGEELIVQNVGRTARIPLSKVKITGTVDDARTSSRWGVTSRHSPVMPDDNTVRDARLLRLIDIRKPDEEISVQASLGRSPRKFDETVVYLEAMLAGAAD